MSLPEITGTWSSSETLDYSSITNRFRTINPKSARVAVIQITIPSGTYVGIGENIEV